MKIRTFVATISTQIKQKHYSYKTYKYIFLAIPLLFQIGLNTRSAHRPRDTKLPTITVQWVDNDKDTHSLKSRYLRINPFFNIFEQEYYDSHQLPNGKVTFRYEPEKSVAGTELGAMIEKLIKQIKGGKRIFDDFTILRDSNFNYKRHSGLLILRCNKFPFVVKLFMENPYTFVHPFKKGFEPVFFYFMGGGINRHLSGFTRIKNLENFIDITKDHPKWSKRVVLPRKWFYAPKDCRWLKITGTNFTPEKMQIKIPGTYCIVADAMRIERHMTIFNKNDRKESLQLCNDVGYSIDPHIDNFGFETDTGLIVLVDTERMNDIVGWNDIKKVYTSQFSWYFDLSKKCFKDMFFRPKNALIAND